MKSIQTSRTNRKHILIPTALAFGAVLLLFGCSADQMSAPTNLDRSPVGAAQWIPDRGISGEDSAIFSKVIGSTGGVVYHEGVLLRFPPRSLSCDTEITIVKLPSDPDKVVFELLPHGIEFNKSVTLIVNLAAVGIGPDEEGTIYWYDPEKEGWIDLEARNCWPIAWVKLDHFSKYGGGGRSGW